MHLLILSLLSQRLFQTFGKCVPKCVLCYSLTDITRSLSVGRLCISTHTCLSVLRLVPSSEAHETEPELCKSRQLSKYGEVEP